MRRARSWKLLAGSPPSFDFQSNDMPEDGPASRASMRLATDDSRSDQVSDAKRFGQHAPNGGEGERVSHVVLLRPDIGHPQGPVIGADGLNLVPPNDLESFLPVVEAAAQCGRDGIEIRFLPGDRDDRAVDRLVERIDVDDVEAADRGPVDQDRREPSRYRRRRIPAGVPLAPW